MSDRFNRINVDMNTGSSSKRYNLQALVMIQFSSVQFSSVQFSSVQFSSVQFSSVRFDSI